MKNIKLSWGIFSQRRRIKGAIAPRLLVSAEAEGFIKSEVDSCCCRDLETGGILIGRIESKSLIRVTHASGPGPKATHTPASFLRDTAYCANVLHEHYEKFGLDYVGEWHSHVEPLKKPSSGDMMTSAGIMADPDYDFPAFAMLLAVPNRKWRPRIKLHGFVITREVLWEVKIEDGSEFESMSEK